MQKLLLKDGVNLLKAIGYTFEGIDSGVRLYYHPCNPRQHLFPIPCHYEPDDELSAEITMKIYEALKCSASIKH